MEGTYPVVALTSSEIRSVTELKGKRLGIVTIKDSPFDVGYAQQLKIYTTVLSTAKLTLADVELVPIERPRTVSSLNLGSDNEQATAEFHRDLAARLGRGNSMPSRSRWLQTSPTTSASASCPTRRTITTSSRACTPASCGPWW